MLNAEVLKLDEPHGRILHGCTSAQYHADPCATPSLSVSTATTIVSRSPYHAWLEHPRLGGTAREPTAAMDAGTVFHALLLEEGDGVAVIDAEDYRTKAAREARDEARAAGRTPVLAEEHAAAVRSVADVRAQLGARGIELDGESEIAIEWRARSATGPVLCRSRLDHLRVGPRGATIIDFKRVRSASPAACARSSFDHGYDMQSLAYVRAVEAVYPELTGRVEFLFVFVEEPEATGHALITTARMGGSYRELGLARWSRAVDAWARCMARNEWPAYPTGVVALECPPWAGAEENV